MAKTYRIAAVCFIVFLTLFLACSKNGPGPEPPKYKWTILGYFDGNNPQDQTPEGHSYVIHDEQELEHIDSTQDIQVVVMLGSFKTGGNCKYYHIQSGLDKLPDSVSSEVLKDLGKKDMSDPLTLRDFISFGMDKYPADHYLLILNDHASGWKGLCSDQINGSGNWMTLPELSSALSGFKFDIIWFYTPSMAAVEVAYQIKDRADYMIASQYKWYPEKIMGAAIWLPYLTKNPNVAARDFAKKIPEAIDSAAYLISDIKHFHAATIYLSGISHLASTISKLGQSLIDHTGSDWSEVWGAWEYAHNYTDLDSLSVDLRAFTQSIQTNTDLDSTIKNRAQEVEDSLPYAVIEQYLYPEYTDQGGISIHFPWDQYSFDSVSYSQLLFTEKNWSDFLSAFITTYSGNYACTFDIKSNPTGARIYIDDVDTGDSTNVIIGGIYPGHHVVKLTKSGYQDWISPDYSVFPQTTQFVYAILKPGP